MLQKTIKSSNHLLALARKLWEVLAPNLLYTFHANAQQDKKLFKVHLRQTILYEDTERKSILALIKFKAPCWHKIDLNVDSAYGLK